MPLFDELPIHVAFAAAADQHQRSLKTCRNAQGEAGGGAQGPPHQAGELIVTGLIGALLTEANRVPSTAEALASRAAMAIT